MNITVFQLEWPSASVDFFNDSNHGLWENSHQIAIHIPHFEESWNTTYKKHTFYVAYDNTDPIEKMISHNVALNDIVFYYPSWRGVKKAIIYFS
jgi:hypothetical protein